MKLAPLRLYCLAAAALGSVASFAQDTLPVPPLNACEMPREADKFQVLRRLSLDLRGHVPTPQEYAALETASSVSAETIASMMKGDDFRLAMRKYHENLFWPNVSNVSLQSVNSQLSAETRGTEILWHFSNGSSRTTRYRGAGASGVSIFCSDKEETTFDPAYPGEFRMVGATGTTTAPTPAPVEGWRWVHPYWEKDPAVKIKVCGYDAQETVSANINGKAVSCGSIEALGRRECGCGPNLRFCYGPASTNRGIVEAMREQLNRQVDAVTVGKKPYTDLMLSTKIQVNGPLNFWKKYVAENLNTNRVFSLADSNEPLSDLDFNDPTWKEVDRGGQHAGVLTAPAFLLRFQTNRGRANRERINFECEPFAPPAEIETSAAGCSDTGTDLTKRCTCRYCHQSLEPLAAHWGNFAEGGITALDETRFPRMRNTGPTSCLGKNAGSGFCRRFYVTDSDADNPGALYPYQYADAAHPTITAALAGGPRMHAQEIISSGAFAKCTTKRMFAYLMKRNIRAQGGAINDEQPLLDSLVAKFTTNYDLPTLIQAIVSLPQYRSVR